VSSADFRALARAASLAYPGGDRFARNFAYGKLKGDPVFKWILEERLVAPGSRVLDLGCGQALLASLLFAARVERLAYTGIDLRERDIERGRAMARVLSPAAAGSATLRRGDICFDSYPKSDLIVMLDVLHYVDYRSQASVFDRVTEALAPGGTLLLRVADDDGSLRFRWTTLVDRLSNRLRGETIRKLYCRSLYNWREHLHRRRLAVTPVPMSAGTFFNNIVLLARYDS
jgi:SAM-dependent methyltransferase